MFTTFSDCNINLQKETESFVNYYIEAQGPDYDHERLSFTVKNLLLAGTETSATFIRWAIAVLTNHVSIQERLHAEIDSVIGRQKLPALDDRSRSVKLTKLHLYLFLVLQQCCCYCDSCLNSVNCTFWFSHCIYV